MVDSGELFIRKENSSISRALLSFACLFKQYVIISQGGNMNTNTIAKKIYKAFTEAGFNVGHLADVTYSLPSFRFLINKEVKYNSFSSCYKNLVNVFTSEYTGKTFVYVDCDSENYNKILSVLTPFINYIDLSVHS